MNVRTTLAILTHIVITLMVTNGSDILGPYIDSNEVTLFKWFEATQLEILW